jgi:membrane-associated phospholipid phosphatase
LNQAEAKSSASACAGSALTPANSTGSDRDRHSKIATRCWIGLCIGALLTLVAWFFDQRISDVLTRPAVRDRIYQVFALPTAISFYAIVAAILASFSNRRRLLTGFFCAVLLSGLLTHVLKFVVGRARPALGLGPESFDLFNLLGPNQSFPSGHASAAATLAVLLGLYFPTARWVFYFYALCVGLERIVNNRHFTSDVLAGFVIGALTVYLCVLLLGRGYFKLQHSGRTTEAGA